MKLRMICVGMVIALAVGPASAENKQIQAMEAFLDERIRPMLQEPILVRAITHQNRQTAGYSSDRVLELDQAWRSEVGTNATPTISPILDNAVSGYLREQVATSGGQITEIFVMDAVGLNVAASAVTSDYWQGDEDKFTKTFAIGPDAVHFGEIEFDASSQKYQAQISVSITDPATGAVIGAMTVGINANDLI